MLLVLYFWFFYHALLAKTQTLVSVHSPRYLQLYWHQLLRAGRAGHMFWNGRHSGSKYPSQSGSQSFWKHFLPACSHKCISFLPQFLWYAWSFVDCLMWTFPPRPSRSLTIDIGTLTLSHLLPGGMKVQASSSLWLKPNLNPSCLSQKHPLGLSSPTLLLLSSFASSCHHLCIFVTFFWSRLSHSRGAPFQTQD